MHIVKRLMALCLALLVLMMTTACAEVPFLVHSLDWSWDGMSVDVLLKADVDTHMPFDDDRLAMLTPITDMLSLRLVAGGDDELVSIGMGDEELLTLWQRGGEMQLSCLPETTYQAAEDPLKLLLGVEASAGGYEMLRLAPESDTLVSDGAALLEKIPEVFEQYGKRSANTTNISGYGKAAYRYDYTITAAKVGVVKDALLSICPEGWLYEIISGLTFSGKQTLRVYYTAEDVMLRAEYNGSCGPEDNQRTVKLVYKMRHDDTMDKDYIELTSPAKKGKNKNNLTYECTTQTDKKGARVIEGTFTYTATADSVTSIWKGSYDFKNAFSDSADHITGEVTFEYKLNGADKYDALTLAPDLTISGTEDSPVVTGTLTVTEKYAGKVTEQAAVSIDLKKAEALAWKERAQTVDLSALDADALAAVQQEISSAVATAIVRPLILTMGKDAEWFFRELPEDAVQSIIDAAGAAQ